jgi:hypothetical protein
MRKIFGMSIVLGMFFSLPLSLVLMQKDLASAEWNGEQIAPSSERNEIALSPKILEQYVGIYQFPGFHMMIALENGQLTAQVTGGGKTLLVAKSETRFSPKVGDRMIDDEFEFNKDENGKISSLTLNQRPIGRVTKAPKISDEVPQHKEIALSPQKLEQYVGTYKLEPGVDEVITLEGNQLFTSTAGQEKIPIFPESETTFFLKVMDAQREFIKNDKGKITYLIRRQGPSETRAPRADTTGRQKEIQAIDGIWTGATNGQDGKPLVLIYEFEAAGEALVGTVWSSLGGGLFSEGKIEGNKISFVVRTDQFTINTSGTLSGDLINITQKSGDSTSGFVLKRVKFPNTPITSKQPNIAGEYQGIGPGAGQPPMTLQIERGSEKGWIGRLYQGPQPIPIDSVTLQGSAIKYSTSVIIRSSYEGRISEDGKVIKGISQPFGPPPLHFQRISAVTSSHTARFITVEKDVKIEVLDWGGSGKPLILLAAAILDAHSFDKMAPKLTDEYHVYAITRRGRITPESSYSSDRLGDDILAVINALKLNRPVLAGSSYAGEEMSNLGWRYPDKISGLIYLDAAFTYDKGNERYTEIKVPVLGIFPEGPQSNYPVFKKDAPSSLAARIVQLKNAGHLIYMTNEADVVREMKAFLKGLP